jgi:hypothetical protein
MAAVLICHIPSSSRSTTNKIATFIAVGGTDANARPETAISSAKNMLFQKDRNVTANVI